MTRRRLTYAGVAIAALAALLGLWRWRSASSAGEVHYETAKVDRGRVVAKVTATGTLSALVTVQVGSQVSGRISELRADFNSRVRKGEVIARIDPQLFRAAVAQAKANTVAAEGNLAKARAQAADADRQLGRTRQLAERNLVAAADLDTAQANADGARAGVQAAQGTLAQTRAALQQAQVNLGYTDIVSPTNGVVISRNVDVGQTVAASLQAPILFVIAEDLAKMQVDTSVAEADVGRLRAGMPATFTVDAYPNEVFSGTVRQVRNASTTVQNVVTYDAVVDVANPELKLKPGMTATVTFVYAQRDDVLRVPNAALRFRPPPGLKRPVQGAQAQEAAAPAGQGARAAARPDRSGGDGARARPEGGRTVWVLRGEARDPVPVAVQTGITDGSATELVSGDLREGDAVVTDATGGAASGRQGGGGGAMRRGPF
ncbi:efflux transporter, RND family, MFP subunit [Anaeromyxobacter dehalogenans 2CP-1]|uniref:Efflux transporter, RND family, MFP subunit n=1 Tax=Anaeromyxobacter dehalogenans (strain ATCC BAA-258 / DSM 21875 / 2CP-1) TaxID=455488 RepID=B8JGA0_ANAD2|nr:efflux RND transporter periplasmic adaptor subunit [Anaeromyxobacter dehalogenans]ACL66503.1 efflux transporter, RND family, MFP subunit [Anaeromyxobacter dehalogenans 2CP-1]